MENERMKREIILSDEKSYMIWYTFFPRRFTRNANFKPAEMSSRNKIESRSQILKMCMTMQHACSYDRHEIFL